MEKHIFTLSYVLKIKVQLYFLIWDRQPVWRTKSSNFNNTMIRTRLPHRTQLRTISMILTVAFDNKCDQIDEADCMFIFQIKHQYSFWIIAHILFNALLRVLNRFSSGHNFERHHNNLSSVNYLMTTVKIERAFIHLRSHIHLYIIHMK